MLKNAKEKTQKIKMTKKAENKKDTVFCWARPIGSIGYAEPLNSAQ